ncbi:hypothetical protein Taro_015874 [Colocasia esculenta]|uniref:Uncharacterized protein n=1 Tax=Colocasia esculenta TaxID=4460 RepID=A0A843UM20_COLES|nr:hypothetical protein [Colocasia esculenta]
MVIPRLSGRKVEAEQQFGAFPLDPLEALGWEAAPCSLHLSTDALRNGKPELCPGLTVCICRQQKEGEGIHLSRSRGGQAGHPECWGEHPLDQILKSSEQILRSFLDGFVPSNHKWIVLEAQLAAVSSKALRDFNEMSSLGGIGMPRKIRREVMGQAYGIDLLVLEKHRRMRLIMNSGRLIS